MDLSKLDKIILNDNILKSHSNSNILKSLKGFILQQQQYNAAIKEIRTKLEILDEEFKIKYDYNPIHHIEHRLKSPESIIQKLRRKNLEISLDSIRKNLTDVAGVRVICNYIDDIYRISDLLLGQDDVTLLEKRDYITCPKDNGYRSLHLIVTVPVFLSEKTEKIPVEIQIRTIAMDFWASLEHQLKYKSHNEVSNDLRQRLKKCADSIAELDSEMQAIYREIKSKKK